MSKKDFVLLKLTQKSQRSAEDWLIFLEINGAFESIETKAIVQSLNLESLFNSERQTAILNGNLFEGKKVYPFSTSREAAKRELVIPRSEIVCHLFEHIINDSALASTFERFVVIGEEFDDDKGEYYLMVSMRNGKPFIDKYYCDPIPGRFACDKDAYVFEG